MKIKIGTDIKDGDVIIVTAQVLKCAVLMYIQAGQLVVRTINVDEFNILFQIQFG